MQKKDRGVWWVAWVDNTEAGRICLRNVRIRAKDQWEAIDLGEQHARKKYLRAQAVELFEDKVDLSCLGQVREKLQHFDSEDKSPFFK